jgi:membrane-bound lytic murein transglycosylase D
MGKRPQKSKGLHCLWLDRRLPSTFAHEKDYILTRHLFRAFICFSLIHICGCAHQQDPPPPLSPASDESSPFASNETRIDTAETPPKAPAGKTSQKPRPPKEALLADFSPVGPDDAQIPAVEPDPEKPEAGDNPLLVQGIQQQLDEALDFCRASQELWQNGELESALEALDKAYSLILTVEPDDPAKMVQQKEDLRFLISKRILEIYASRNIVVNGNHNAIPREINSNVQKEIDRFTKGYEKGFFIDSYRRSGKYRPMILRKLAAAGLPAELSWLPLIESGFKVKAFSKARALGLWQFIPSTGYKFGLKRDQYVDERIDFEKSTDAAIAYLIELHNIFGDWSTVLAAYNCGEGRVLRVIRTQNINYLDDFWDLYGRLPFETARYVPRFLAALHIVENLEKYGLADIEPDPPLTFETVDVQRQIHLKRIAAPLGTTLAALKELNPELRHSVLPADTYSLRVPVGQTERLLAAIDQIPLSTPPQHAFVYHRVQRGETLSTIARRYRTSVAKIMWANNLKSASYIVAGKRLKIPQRGMVVSPAAANTAAEPKTWNRKHVVKSGDSLWIIAKKYDTTTRRIQEVNHLSGTQLRIGQVLIVPSQGRASQKDPEAAAVYYVRRGDSPYIIARRHNISLNRFLKINNLTARCTIYPGQAVRID